MNEAHTSVSLGNRRSLKRQQAPERKSRFIQLVGVAVLVMFLFGIGIVAGTYTFLGAIYDPPVSGGEGVVIAPGERITILFMGIDHGVTDNGPRPGVARSDTMVLVTFDPDTLDTGVIHLPRDTRVTIPGRPGFDKLGHAHAYGGPLLTMETVSQFLEIPVHYYVRADFDGFVEAVNVLGGVELEVERNMFYEDPYQDLYIDLKAGLQTLDGQQALQFVRYRQYPDADIGRIRAQQQFIKAFIDKFFNLNMVWRIPSLVQLVVRHVSTDIDPNTMLSLAGKAVKLDNRDRIVFEMLPGDTRNIVEGGRTLSFWVTNPVSTSKIVDSLVRGIDREANAGIRIRIRDGNDSSAKVTVLANQLRGFGYMVIEDGKAERQNYQQTHLIAHDQDERTILGVTRAVGQLSDGNVMLIDPVDEEDYFDFTIIVGTDIGSE